MRSDQRPALLACVILAHTDSVHVHRLVEALDPFPVFLHVDPTADPDIVSALTAGLPERAVLLDPVHTGRARWENVEAVLDAVDANPRLAAPVEVERAA
jgi:hypothetical protein